MEEQLSLLEHKPSRPSERTPEVAVAASSVSMGETVTGDTERRRLLLFDANNLVHRLWHAKNSPTPLEERWGFALQRWRKKIRPDFALAIFDGSGETWRHRAWPRYKARDSRGDNRPTGQDWQSVKLSCRAAKLVQAELDGTEADDLIASYAVAGSRDGLDVVIVSSDKDIMQLCRETPSICQIDPTGKVWGPSEVQERWGVWPHSLADVLALAGDSSDNYPGIKGIGPATAAKLIRDHGDIEQIIERIGVLPTKLAHRIGESIDDVRLFRRLAELSTDIPLPHPISSATW